MTELDKWSESYDDFVIINDFLTWLNSKGIQLCESVNDFPWTRFYPASKTHQQIIESYFDINSTKLEQERRELLLELHKK